jgi:phosphoribosylaminoimidazole-succinocarboxamide synthase
MDNVLMPSFRQIAINGKNKTLFRGNNMGEFILMYQDPSAIVRNKMSQIVFNLLTDCFIPNHFIKEYGPKEQTVIALEMMPFIVGVHAFTNDQMARRLQCASGVRLRNYIVEISLKDSPDVVISPDHVMGFEWIKQNEWNVIYDLSKRIMDILYGFFSALDVVVASVRLEFGRRYQGGSLIDIYLGDEMSWRNISFIIPDLLDADPMMEIARRMNVIR